MEVICEFKYLKEVDGLVVYTCNVGSVSITQPNIEIESFKGQHEERQDNNGVKEIHFFKAENSNTTVEFFPRGLLNNFPNVTYVDIEGCGLKSICREDLMDFLNLETFYVGRNDLKSLPSNLFLDKPKLKEISFYCNKLEFVSSQLLQPIIKNGLTIVDFEKNARIDAGYSVDTNDNNYSIDNNVSLEQLMELIDTQCSKPPEEFSGFNDDLHKDEINNKVAELWTSGRFSDFKIVVKESKEFRVHKSILGSRSSVFAALFDNDMEENKTGKMTIVDFSASVIEQFLGFLYTGSVPDDVNAMELFAIAAKYDVPNLKMLGEKTILKNLCQENALEVFNLSQRHSSDDLKLAAFKCIQHMFPGKILSENLRNDPDAINKLVIAAKNISEKARAAEDALAAASRDYQVKIKDVKNELEMLVKSVNENA